MSTLMSDNKVWFGGVDDELDSCGPSASTSWSTLCFAAMCLVRAPLS